MNLFQSWKKWEGRRAKGPSKFINYTTAFGKNSMWRKNAHSFVLLHFSFVHRIWWWRRLLISPSFVLQRLQTSGSRKKCQFFKLLTGEQPARFLSSIFTDPFRRYGLGIRDVSASEFISAVKTWNAVDIVGIPTVKFANCGVFSRECSG